LGDFAGRPDTQGTIKSKVALEAMKKMDYDALVLGEREIALGDDFVFKQIKKGGVPLVDTNVEYNGRDVGKRKIIIKRGGLKIGILGLTLDQTRAGQEAWTIEDPFEAVKEVLPDLRKKVDIVILLSHIGYRQSVALAEDKDIDGIDVVLVGHGGRRVKTPQSIGNAIMAEAGSQGKYVGRVDLTYDREEKKITDFSGKLIPLDSKVADDEKMQKLYSSYQEQVKDLVKKEAKGRKETTGTQPSNYMGAVWCRSCHTDIYKAWNGTPHAKAFFTLREKGEEYNPECVGCHTTGYGKGGFLTANETPTFINVQCEACHGSASKHVADKGKTPLRKMEAAVCLRCHTPERDENFDYNGKKALVH